MSTERVKIIVPDVPAKMRRAVDAYAKEHDLSRNQVAVDALLARYDLKPDGGGSGGYRPSVTNGVGPWSLEVPVKVRAALRREAASKDYTISGIVRATLAEKLGLPAEDASRKPRAARRS